MIFGGGGEQGKKGENNEKQGEKPHIALPIL
jgi:hypothetical protein